MEAAHTPLQFWAAFMQRCTDVKDRADEVAAKVSREVITRELGVQEMDNLLSEMSAVQKMTTETTVVLPPYDVRRTQEEIQGVKKKLQQMRDSFVPKKKFTFRSRLNKSSSNTRDEDSAAETKCAEPKTPDHAAGSSSTPDVTTTAAAPSNTNIICNKSNEVLRVTQEQMGTSNDVLLKNCSNCTIFIPHVLGFARLENITSCTIILGPVSGACYLESCVESTIAVCCHQLRIHNTRSCQIYATASSNPIIEDCSELGFAPFSIQYHCLPAQLQAASLEDAKNWNSVVDFKWLRSQRSPNWYEIEESSRKEGPVEHLPDVSFSLRPTSPPS